MDEVHKPAILRDRIVYLLHLQDQLLSYFPATFEVSLLEHSESCLENQKVKRILRRWVNPMTPPPVHDFS
jgi:hypothetical protein